MYIWFWKKCIEFIEFILWNYLKEVIFQFSYNNEINYFPLIQQSRAHQQHLEKQVSYVTNILDSMAEERSNSKTGNTHI